MSASCVSSALTVVPHRPHVFLHSWPCFAHWPVLGGVHTLGGLAHCVPTLGIVIVSARSEPTELSVAAFLEAAIADHSACGERKASAFLAGSIAGSLQRTLAALDARAHVRAVRPLLCVLDVVNGRLVRARLPRGGVSGWRRRRRGSWVCGWRGSRRWREHNNGRHLGGVRNDGRLHLR